MVKVYLKKEVVENLLARKHLSQNWLALKLDISSGYMSQLLNGERCPSPKIRKKIENIFQEKKFDNLFYVKNERQNKKRKGMVREV